MNPLDDFLPPGMSLQTYYNLHPREKMALERKRNRQPSGTVGHVLGNMERAIISRATDNAYSRDRYGPKAWDTAMDELAKLGFSMDEIAWVLNSKYARWAADAFHKQTNVVVDEEGELQDFDEAFDGTELTQYHAKWGISLKDMD